MNDKQISPPLIFIVEDSPIIRELVEFTLKKTVFCYVMKYSSCRQVLEALDLITPDLMILDYALDNNYKNAPNGLFFLKILKQMKINIPTIVFSGQIRKDIAINMVRNGAIDYISKESDMFLDELIMAVNKVLTFRNNISEMDASRIKKLRAIRKNAYRISGF